MKKLSSSLLASTISARRNAQSISQAKLAELTGINRALISRIESQTFTPSVDQLQALAEVLNFNITDVIADEAATTEAKTTKQNKSYKIAVAGTGYVGLSLAVLLSQHNKVTAVDIIQEKVDKLNNGISPIQDDYIELYLKEASEGKRSLNLTATTDGNSAYKSADFIVIAAPTNYDPQKNFFDCSAVESVIKQIKEATKSKKVKPTIVIKSTIPVGYTSHIREKLGMDNIIFSPEFLRESKALYDNLYPSRIIVGCDEKNKDNAIQFAKLLQQGALKEDIETLFMAAPKLKLQNSS